MKAKTLQKLILIVNITLTLMTLVSLLLNTIVDTERNLLVFTLIGYVPVGLFSVVCSIRALRQQKRDEQREREDRAPATEK